MSDDDGTIRIVVGVDFTELGDQALDEAIRYLAKIDNDELHAAFVIAQPPKNLAEAERALEVAQTRLRERVVERCEATGQRWDQRVVFHVRIGDPAKALHQIAVDVDADLIVVGTHARRGLAKMLIGSVAEDLVRTAHVPIMVSRKKELAELPRSAEPDPARPGEDLHDQRVLADEHLSFGKRPSHISGLV